MDNRCVCCGEMIPEGIQVCPKCEDKTDKEVMPDGKKENRAN